MAARWFWCGVDSGAIAGGEAGGHWLPNRGPGGSGEAQARNDPGVKAQISALRVKSRQEDSKDFKLKGKQTFASFSKSRK